MDRLLWRTAQRVLARHVVKPDGTCQWCGRRAPCSPQRLAERADAVSRRPSHEASPVRSKGTRLVPAVASNSRPAGPSLPGDPGSSTDASHRARQQARQQRNERRLS